MIGALLRRLDLSLFVLKSSLLFVLFGFKAVIDICLRYDCFSKLSILVSFLKPRSYSVKIALPLLVNGLTLARRGIKFE